jgi:proteic killer suppression protein
MIKSFRHRGLEKFFKTDSKAGIKPEHARKLRQQLTLLDEAMRPSDMGVPSWDLHPLRGELVGHWSVSVNGNWRLTFCFDGVNAEVVDYQDYH